MPIRKLKISFDIDMETLARMLALGHSSLNIEAYEPATEPRVTQTNQIANGHDSVEIVLLKALKKSSLTSAEMRGALAESGWSVKSLGCALHDLKKRKLVKSIERGHYGITTKGLELLA